MEFGVSDGVLVFNAQRLFSTLDGVFKMPTPDSKTIHRERLVGLLLALVTFALYWPVREFEFNNYDDAQYITQNSRIHAGLTLGNVAWAFQTGYAGNWHPLTWLSHMLDCQLYGLNPGGHHLTNVLFHVANTVLLFGLLRRLTNAFWRSAFVAALFAWHPMHVESVAWVAERKDVLSAFFWILTIWAYWRYTEESKVQSPKSKVFYLIALFLFALGLLSKPMVVTLPLVLLLLDYWPLGRVTGSRLPLLLEKVPFFALTFISCVVTFLVQRKGGAVAASDVPMSMRLENALNSCLSYVEKLLWPQRLCILYPYSFHLPLARVIAAALLMLAITVIAARCARNRPYLIVGWLWFLIMLVPVIGLVQVGEQAMADRYTYLPSIGLFLMLAWEASERLGARAGGRWVLGALAVLCLSGCLTVSVVQLRCWRNSVTLFTQALNVTTDNALAQSNLGAALAAQGKLPEALDHFQEALRIRPFYREAQINEEKALVLQGKLDEAVNFNTSLLKSHPDDSAVHHRLALVLVQQGKLDEAIEHFHAALRGNPQDDTALANLGLALARQGREEEAMVCYRQALQIAPDNAYAHYGLAQALDTQDKLDEAGVQYQQALSIKPDLAEAHNGLGAILAAQGKFEAAGEHLRAALQFKPDFPEARYNFGNAWLSQGKMEEAITNYMEAIRLRPGYFEAQFNFANALARQQQWAAALEHYSEALRLRPDFADAHGNIGVALDHLGRTKEAIEHYRLALQANSNAPIPLKKLAWILATSPDPTLRDATEALRLANLATQLAPTDPTVWDAQAAACAEAGQFAQALSAAKKAAELAAAKDPALAGEIQKRLALYEAGKPFRQGITDGADK